MDSILTSGPTTNPPQGIEPWPCRWKRHIATIRPWGIWVCFQVDCFLYGHRDTGVLQRGDWTRPFWWKVGKKFEYLLHSTLISSPSGVRTRGLGVPWNQCKRSFLHRHSCYYKHRALTSWAMGPCLFVVVVGFHGGLFQKINYNEFAVWNPRISASRVRTCAPEGNRA